MINQKEHMMYFKPMKMFITSHVIFKKSNKKIGLKDAKINKNNK